MKKTASAGWPRLPAIVVRGGSHLPLAPVARALQAILRRTFAAALADGELDFLEARELVLAVEDAGVAFAVTLDGGRLCVMRPQRRDAVIRGCAAAFIVLAAKRADADTLFFQRVLIAEGDTELGLAAKYLIEATPLERLPAPLRALLHAAAAAVVHQLPGEFAPAAPRQ